MGIIVFADSCTHILYVTVSNGSEGAQKDKSNFKLQIHTNHRHFLYGNWTSSCTSEWFLKQTHTHTHSLTLNMIPRKDPHFNILRKETCYINMFFILLKIMRKQHDSGSIMFFGAGLRGMVLYMTKR